VRIVPAHWTRPTRGDLALAALVGVLFALSPLTGRRRILPSLVLGALAAGAVIAARMRRGPPARGHSDRPDALASAWPVVGVLALTAILFAPTLYWLFLAFTESVWRNGTRRVRAAVHGAARAQRAAARPGQRGRVVRVGLCVARPALVLVVADAGIRSRYLSVIGLVLALPGLSLLLLGARRTRAIALPLALGVFLVPIPTLLEDTVGLRVATSAVAKPVLQWIGAPVIWHQTQVRLPNSGFSISDNCSGFAALVASFAFAALLAVTARSRVRGALLLLSVYPAVALANGLRLVALALLVVRFGDPVLITTPLHGLSGIGVFIVVLGGLWLCADRAGFREAIS
jgi:exosortase